MRRPLGVRSLRGVSSVAAPSGAAPVFDPTTLSLSLYVRAAYTGSPWTGVASAGGSSGRNLTEASNPPTATSGYADFDGTDDTLAAGVTNATLFGSSGSFFALVWVDAAPAPAASNYDRGTIFTDPTNAETTFGVSTSGFEVSVLDDTVSYVSPATPKACSTGAWHLVQAKWDGSNLKTRVDSGAWSSDACGPMTTLSASNPNVGKTYSGAFFDGRIRELGCSTTALSDADFTNLVSYMNTTYGLSL